MKYISVFFLFFLSQILGFAQNIIVKPLSYEYRGENSTALSNARIMDTISVHADSIKLRLPFFDDFSSVQVPIDTLKNDIGQAIIISSRGLHGLKSGDVVNFYGTTYTIDSLIPYLQRPWTVQVLDPFHFKLLTIHGTDTLGNGQIITNKGYWLRNHAKMSTDPDPLKWEQNNGGAYINTRFGIDPPSYGVATFDGLNYKGEPYNKSSAFVDGGADTLTSRSIDLSDSTIIKAKNSLYFSFYCQAGGLGDFPDTPDSLQLEFLDKDSNWVYRASFLGEGELSPFLFKSVGFADSASIGFFHSNFRFRFHSYGRLSGAFSIWNIDYVYLNTGRNANDSLLGDVSIVQGQSPLLKNYTAMPLSHLLASPSEWTDTVTITSKNNRIGGALNEYDVNIVDTVGGKSFSLEKINTTGSAAFTGFGTITAQWPDAKKVYNTIAPQPKDKRAVLSSKFFLAKSDSIIAGLDLQINNFDSAYTVLDNYYAHDDGTAEAAFGITASGSALSRTASKFHLSKIDTLRSVAIYFPERTPLDNGAKVKVYVFRALINGKTSDNDLASALYTIKFQPNINGFDTITFSSPVILDTGAFYIALEKQTDNLVSIGLDKNNAKTKDTNNYFIKINKTWDYISSYGIYGKFMIRPFFKAGDLTPVKDPTSKELSVDIFPNPTTGELNIVGNVENIKVYDISGRQLFEEKLDVHRRENKINLNQLPPGFYLIHLSSEDLTAVKKLIISR